ncbi:14412_t:CDS:2, partial [Dentiscutata heterogama]
FDKTVHVDNFYIEMNEIIHENFEKYTNVDDIFNATCDYLNELVSMVKPKKLIFIAVDGVAPRAKMNEQRSRRLFAISSGFDPNYITPGTKFMVDFSNHLKEFIHNKIQNDEIWKIAKFVYSGPDVPGEGEQKIIKYIRNSESKSDCIYGRDSDLILMGLLHYKSNLRILSSNKIFLHSINKNSRIYEIRLLGTLRRKIKEEFFELWESKPLPFEFNIESIIKDFILLVLFMGSDFMPMLPNINNKKLDIISTYKEMLKECGGYIFNDDRSLNKRRLENDELLKWKKKYYLDQDQKILITSYIEGLQWVHSYYEGSLKSYRWFYPGHHSPLISDLEDLEIIEIKSFKDEDYYKPFEQLMFVLPIRSKKLLPVAYQNLMNDPRIEVFYSTDKNDNLPFIDEKILLSVLKSAENNLTNEEKQRNEFGNVLLFEYDELNKK